MVEKRLGKMEPFDSEKPLAHLKESCKDLDVDPYNIMSELKIRISDGMKTNDIQLALIHTTANKIDVENRDYQYAAARLVLQRLYKDLYGSYKPHFDSKDLRDRTNKGFYDPEIFSFYTDTQIDNLSKIINYENDKKFTYLGINQLNKKYSIKKDGEPIESPQEVFFLIPLYIFARVKNKKLRNKLIKKAYKKLSNFDIFLPTPSMCGIRTNMKGFTSCAGINFGNSIESFGNASKSLYKLITKLRAGIGMNIGNVSGLGAPIMGGQDEHTGVVRYAKANEAISRSSMQPSSGRSGAVTNYYPFFHIEIESILQLKNNKGSEEMSVRHSDHCIVFDKLVKERIENNDYISLFYMNETEELYELIGMEGFKEKYEELENNPAVFKKRIKAKSLEDSYFQERYTTNRVYKLNANSFQKHSAFNLPTSSNLCTEINLPSFPDKDFYIKVKSISEFESFIESLYDKGIWYQLYRFIFFKVIDEKNATIVEMYHEHLDNDGEDFTLNFGEIFSCILGGINFGNLSTDTQKRRIELEDSLYVLNYFLDELIDYQDYQRIKPFERFTKNRRALGISPGNYFYMLAKHGFNYDTIEARNLTAQVMEEFLFYSLKSSNILAKEKGRCKWYNDTKYSKGVLPIDTYEKNVDMLYNTNVHNILSLGWDKLREDIKRDGLRNSTMLTAVPSSNSSRPGNMISGINPPQGAQYSIEDNKMKVVAVLPEVKKYLDFYNYNSAWEIDTLKYWQLIAIIQKFTDQTISLNEYVDFSKYSDKKIPKSEVIKRDMFMDMFGIETVYYVKSKTDNDAEDLQDESTCIGGGCTL